MDECRIFGGKSKFIDTNETDNSEGAILCKNWRWGTKPWV